MSIFCSHPEFAQTLNLTIFFLFSEGNGTWAVLSLPLCFSRYYPLLRPLMKLSAETVLLMPRNWSPSIFWWYSAAPVLTCNSMWLSVTGSWPKLVLAVKITWLGCMQRWCDVTTMLLLVTVSNISFRDAHSQAERKNCIFLSLAVWSALWFQIASSYKLLFYLGHREQLVDQLETCILTVSRPIYLHIYLCFYIYSVFHHEWNLSLCTLCAFSSNMFLKSETNIITTLLVMLPCHSSMLWTVGHLSWPYSGIGTLISEQECICCHFPDRPRPKLSV